MVFFGLGKFIYVIVLILNAVAILSEDRFLARVGWGRTQPDTSFGASQDPASFKARSVELISSIRTVVRIPLIAVNVVIILWELVAG